MQNRLRFDIESLPHPYADDPSTRVEAWGRLTIRVLNANSQVTLLEYEWNLDELAEWFGAHQRDLCCEQFPKFENIEPPTRNESLSQAIERISDSGNLTGDSGNLIGETTEDEFDRWVDAVIAPLSLYIEGHSLRFALRGARVPPIIIGCNRGRGEISLSTKDGADDGGLWWDPQYDGEWVYSFDMSDFCRHLYSTLRLFLTEWLVAKTDALAQQRVTKLLARLGSDDDFNECCADKG